MALMKPFPLMAAVAATAILAVAGALGLAQLQRQADNEAFNTLEGKAFLETYNALRSDYRKELKPESLMKGAIAGMIESLNDEFTFYISPLERKMQQDTMKGEFFGVGATLNPRNKGKGTGAKVESLIIGAPAATAGIRPGDIIEKVNGESINDLALDEAVQKIRGPKGTTVVLGILRGSNNVEVKIVRDRIIVPSVSSTMLPGNIGYIALSDFLNQNNLPKLRAAISDLKTKNAKGLIFDLRNNGGGLVSQAEEISDLFLQNGDIFITRGRDQKITVEYSASKESSDYTLPMVVLVNQYSASASEIVASALQENGRAKVVGEATVGKGVANIPVKLSNGAQVNVAFEEWLTPKRNSLLKKGVTPDFSIADSRYPKRLALEGLDAPAGASVTVTVNGTSYKLKADAKGKFSYLDEGEVVKTNDRSGNAIVNVENDAQVRKALNVLGVQALK
jgi:carboxyl-terminal processing protease